MDSCSRMVSGRSSRRRRRTSNRPLAGPAVPVALVVSVFLGVAGAAAQSDPDSDAAALDAFLDEVDTLEADFEQVLRDADGRVLERAAGTLALSRPSRFRWRYREPFEQLVVADGRNLWIHDAELEQVTVTPLDEHAASSPAMLLSGDRAVREGFTVVETFGDDGLDWVRLEPELASTDFRDVLIGFDGRVPQRLELVDGLGQVTRIELSGVVVNAELDEEIFEFEPPATADVIGTPAP